MGVRGGGGGVKTQRKCIVVHEQWASELIFIDRTITEIVCTNARERKSEKLKENKNTFIGMALWIISLYQTVDTVSNG